MAGARPSGATYWATFLDGRHPPQFVQDWSSRHFAFRFVLNTLECYRTCFGTSQNAFAGLPKHKQRDLRRAARYASTLSPGLQLRPQPVLKTQNIGRQRQ